MTASEVKANKLHHSIDKFIACRAEAVAISSKSHLVTVFGDVISQHGGWVWLGSLIKALAPLGFSERLVRTSVFRLVKEDWLQVKKQGRRSFYAFTYSANRHYARAAKRIYAASTVHSSGRWLIVIPSLLSDEVAQQFKRQLRWLGFSPLSTGAYAHPSIARDDLQETITESGLEGQVVVFESQTKDLGSTDALKTLVRAKWELDALALNYRQLIDTYKPFIETSLDANKHLIDDSQAFLLRSLLIHEYRRILLKDQQLPRDMLPQPWSGDEATIKVAKLYEQLSKRSCRYIQQELENDQGLLPKGSPEFKQRFKQRIN